MKKIKYILLTAFAITAFSCSSDDLVQFPEDGVGIEAGVNPIKDESTMEFVLKGMYTQFAVAESFNSYIPNLGNLASDDLFVSSTNSGYFLTFHNMNWSAAAGDQNAIYNELYDIVAQANFIINAKIEETDNVKAMKAQAYTARGMAFFYLAQGWGENPTSGKNQEYGIPLYTGEFDPFAFYGRSSVADTYAQIISDLKAGIVAENETPVNKSFLSSTAARLLLAKAYLTVGDYANAISYADDALNKAPGVFSLVTADQLQEYFYSDKVDNQAETVFEIGNSVLANPGVNYSMGVLYDPYNVGTEENTRKSILVRSNLVDLFGADDVRRNLFLKDTRDDDAPNPGYFIKKYKNYIVTDQNIANVKTLRLTEAKFIKWEAMAKSGQGAKALAEVNTFATERGGTTYSGDALAAVLTEKRKEFVGEGQRFFDLKRNNLPIVKATNCNANCNVATGDKLFVLPIPSYSLNINPILKDQQYPGWGN